MAPAFAFVALLVVLGVNVAIAQAAPPVIDGNLNDMIAYAQQLHATDAGCGLYITDKPAAGGAPTPETIYNDLKFIPCPQPQPALGTHWVNGVEIFYHVLAYTPGSTTLYLGIRSEGFIGDSDGNNNPDIAGGGSCNPNDNIKDSFGISGNELYAWNFDLNCDGSPDGRLFIQDNVLVGSGTLAGATGTIAFRQNSGTGATGRDLEVQVQLVAPLPGAFRYENVEANAFDGLSEDRSTGAVCIGTPAITVSKSALPTSVCIGQTTRFSVTIQNTGQTELSIVAKDQLPASLTYAGNLSSTCGVGAPSVVSGAITFPAVRLAAGATCTISYDATAGAQCFGQVSNSVNVVGTFTSACIAEGGAQTVKASATATVTCRTPSSVELTANGPDAACPGAPITISGTARNSGQESTTIVVRVNGAQVYNQTVAAGQTINWTSPVTMPANCVTGQNTIFNVEAKASGECGDSTRTVPVSVRCKGVPCLTLNVNRDLNAACPGDSIAFTGSVANCSPDAENVVLTINGVQYRSSSIAGNGTWNFNTKVAMPQCTAGNAVTFDVVATASSDCSPTATKSVALTVQCNSAPCVEVTANANKQSGCPNEEVVISGVVKNCGTQAANYTVTVGGVQAFTGQVQPGQQANYSRTVSLGNCTAGATVSFPVVATVQNTCGNAQDTKTINVTCNNAPCVELVANRTPTSACPGEPITLSGTVKNCSTGSETIVVTVNGEQVYNQTVNAGSTQNWTKIVSMPQCTAGQSVNWTVVATATGTCPPAATQTQTLSVQCNNAPCIQLIGLASTKSVACPAESLTVYGQVKNCGAQSGNYVVTIGGVQAFSGSLEAGASSSFARSVNLTQCVSGANVDYAVHATVSNSCGNAVADGNISVRCQDKPCVELTANGPQNSCANQPITISGTVRNCGPNAATILVKVGDTQAYNQSVNAGATANWTLQIRMPECTQGDVRQWTVSAIAINDCGRSEKTAQDETKCKLPEIKVKKAAESVVNDGDIIHYTIIVENPGEAPLQNVIVSDPLCPYTVYNNHANPAAFSEPAVGSNGTVTWKIPLLGKGESMAFTFEAKASLSQGGASCPGDVICRNKVTASGTCSGTSDTTPVTATDETATTIRCATQNCPRTAGFWTQQCAQKGNGSTKFTVLQLDQITAKVADVSTFFTWTADSSFSNFCAVINPPRPMNQRQQALRQFAVLLANYATDVLNLTPSAGGQLLLDPNTPISCGGFTATTIGELMTEIDLKLITLAGQDLGNEEVKAKYSAIISCVDAINNGVGIPTIAGCDEGPADDGNNGAKSGGVALSAATPNPFSSTTQFSYEVSGNESNVSVTVYNVAGRQVRTLVLANQQAGRYSITWDGKADDGSSVTRGVYFVRAIVGGQKAPVQRVLYIRNEQ